MNNNNIFLQLRQKDAEEVYKNGDFATQLRRPIVLETGDQIVVNKSIIDSRGANAGKIVLEEETTIGFNFYYYVVNFDTDAKFSDLARNTAKTQADVDNDYYVVAGKTTPSGYEVMELTQVKYTITGSVKPAAKITAQFKYTELNGEEVIHPITLTFVSGGVNQYVSETLSLRARRLGTDPPFEVFVDVTDPDYLKSVGTSRADATLTTQVIGNTTQYFPILGKKSIVMPKGNYTPADFAERFTRLMTLNNQTTIFNNVVGTTDNTLLISTNDDLLTTQTDEACFIRMTDGQKEFFYGNAAGTSPRFVGTNEFELNVDEDTNRFKFSYTHFPFYDSGNEAVRYNEIGTSTDYNLITAYSGILFHGFFSTIVKDGKNTEINLWENQLGFNLNTLAISPQEYVDNTTLGVKVPNFGSNPQIGVEVTSGNAGVDVGVVETGTTWRNVPDLSGNSGLTTNINQTEPIFASGDIASTNFDFGYYLVELQGGIQTDLITNNSMKTNIFSVVGRYYENQNYTTGTTADAIVYQHNGATQYLNSMRVRILNSDFNVPDDLGIDNSVFVQHIKAPQQPPEKS